MDTKKVIEALVKIAEKQQQVIQKLVKAQVAHPWEQPLAPHEMNKHPASAILEKLDPRVKNLLVGNQVEVHNNDVTVFAKPGQPDRSLDIIKNVVTRVVHQLAENNVLPPGQYNVAVQG